MVDGWRRELSRCMTSYHSGIFVSLRHPKAFGFYISMGDGENNSTPLTALLHPTASTLGADYLFSLNFHEGFLKNYIWIFFSDFSGNRQISFHFFQHGPTFKPGSEFNQVIPCHHGDISKIF